MMFNLQIAKDEKTLRELKNSSIFGKFIEFKGKKLLNLGSNDYLGIASNLDLRNKFLELCKDNNWFFGSGASRLIYTSSDEFDRLESWFENHFTGKKATIFNSGYCANLSCISALNSKNTLFLADKLIHASMVDALKLSGAKFKRYPHNDLKVLKEILQKEAYRYDKIIILTEAIFSMDGDSLDLINLVKLKKLYPNVMLYVDEAHSFFIRSHLGLANSIAVDQDIDFLLITLGKGVGSSGAVVLSSGFYKEIFVNSARSLIYSTALPGINIAFSNFILNKDFTEERENLEKNIAFLNLFDSHICPFLTYSNDLAIMLQNRLLQNGYFVPAIRPPTVAKGYSRLRISLRGDISTYEIENLKMILNEIRNSKK